MMPTSDGEARRFVSLFGGARESSDLVGIARTACKEGYSVIAVKPRSKEPICTLTDRQRTAADRMAANAAREAGSRHWEKVTHPCGRSHAIADPGEADKVFKRLVAKHADLNIGLEVGASRLLVVDADTEAEVASFTELWAQMEEVPELAHAAPTVRSPGVLRENVEGEEVWTHKGGGHFWFLLPEGVNFAETPTSAPLKIGAHGVKASLMFRNQLVLVPPSVRDEGPYVMASDIQPAPEWLVDELHAHIARHALRAEHQREAALSGDGDDRINTWTVNTSWDDILTPYGWTTSGRTDRCGCEIWTRPGDWSSPKSATAHEPGCGQFDVTGAFLHLWTDSPPEELAGRKDWSKLQVVAAYSHGGHHGDAMRALGLLSEADEFVVDIMSSDQERLAELKGEDTSDEAEDESDKEDSKDDVDPIDALIAELIPASGLDNIAPPVPLIDGILDRNTLARVFGTSGHGKTFVMIDLAAHVALGKPWLGRECVRGDVVYMVAEGVAGIRARVRAWEAHNGAELGSTAKFLPRAVQTMQQTDWLVWVAAMERLRPALIVLDTQARITVGVNENDAKDMGVVVARADLLRERTGACVVLVHHKGRQGDHGRGSTVVPAALDAEISVTKQASGRITVLSEKQKDREDFSPISLDLIPVDESAVLVPAGTERPFDSNAIDENSPARDRVASLLYRTFNDGNGATKAEVASVVRERDRGPNGKPMSKAAFYKAWAQLEADEALICTETDAGKRWALALAEAVELGLRGPRSGSSEGEL